MIFRVFYFNSPVADWIYPINPGFEQQCQNLYRQKLLFRLHIK
jgi:hypothetical protein